MQYSEFIAQCVSLSSCAGSPPESRSGVNPCRPYAVITLVHTRGHAPQDVGAKAIVTEEGLYWGTVGGGRVEAKAIEFARELIASGAPPALVCWNLQRDVGMSCGGEVTLWFESARSSSWQIVIFGAGHVAQALVRVLEPLDVELVCIDPRPEWLAKLPVSRKTRPILVNDYTDLEEPVFSKLSRYGQNQRLPFFVSITQGHAHDLPVLTQLFRRYSDLPFVGAIGSPVKAIRLRKELVELGIDKARVEKLRCPVGLKFGSNDPHEIAIGIAADLLAVQTAVGEALRLDLQP